VREWLMRLLDMFRRDRLDAELAEELRHHRALAARDGARTSSDLRAREAAREQWSWPWLDQLQQDLRLALRGLRRTPGFAATVIVTLGLGIGANAVMFGVLDRIMFRPFAFLRHPQSVNRVYIESQGRNGPVFHTGYEYTRFLDLQRWTTSFSQVAAISAGATAIGTGQDTRVRRVARVSGTFFNFFDARPALGRFFGPAEDTTPMGAPVVVLSYGFWQAEFGGRADVLGQPLQVGNVLATIIGVTPQGFTGVWEGDPPTAYIPITTYAGSSGGPDDRTNYYTRYNWGWLAMIVRRNPGVGVASASADLTAALERSWDAEAALDPGRTPLNIARPRAIAGALKQAAGPEAGLEARTARWVSGVALIVLVIACANVTNLLLARYLRRRRETAVRLALGVSRGRLIRQSLAEGLVLSLIGCIAAMLVSVWGGAAVAGLFGGEPVPGSVPAGPGLDTRTAMAAAAFALLAGVLTSAGAVLLAPRDDVAGVLKAGMKDTAYRRSGARSTLLVVQGALSVILLIGAGLFVRSLQRVSEMRLGYDPDRVLVVMQNMRGEQITAEQRARLGKRMVEAAKALPGVEAASWASSIPFWSTSSTDLFVTGIDSVRRLGRFTQQRATTEYFKAMGTRIVRGRPFDDTDREGTPRVVVVSAAMARTLWPGRDALGQCIRVWEDTMPCTTVVGIAEDAVQNSMVDDPGLRYYLPMDQDLKLGGHTILVRVSSDVSNQIEPVRTTLQAEMPGLSYVSVFPLREIIAGQRRSWRMGATMFVAFGGLAVVVAAVGLYGVIAYNVGQRMHELGVRIALGARRKHVIRLVLGQGLRFAVLGVGIGLLVAVWGSRWIEPLLFQQSARDPLTYAVVAGLLIAVALAASAGPAVRATRADPNQALRSD
jgi:predicted permease